MKIVVISLPDQVERRAAISRQMHELGLEFGFFDAILGSADPSAHFAATSHWQYLVNARRNPLPNEVGCYASHLNVWKASAKADEPTIVLEDDFVASDRFPGAIGAAGRLIDRFGFIRFEPFRRNPRPTRARLGAHRIMTTSGFEIYYLADPPLCMTGYAISPGAARKLADASRTLIGPVDKFLQRTWQHGVPLFGLSPATINVADEDNVTTIGDRSAKSWNPLLLLARLVYKTTGRSRRNRFNAAQLEALGLSARGD